MHSAIRASMDYVPAAALERLEAAGAVGDILLRFYDATGQPVPAEFDDQVLGLTLEQVRHIPLVIGVAGGLDKVPAIAGALWGDLLDVLICDHATAAAVLDHAAGLAEGSPREGVANAL